MKSVYDIISLEVSESIWFNAIEKVKDSVWCFVNRFIWSQVGSLVWNPINDPIWDNLFGFN